MLIFQLLLTTILLLCTNGEEDNTQRSTSLIEVHTLDGHCDENVCSNFQFNKVSEVAFFDLKQEVRINDGSTYDIISPLQHDVLVFKDSVFAHFPLHLFYSIALSELDMRNCSMEVITWENFLMANNLTILLLSYNRIESISEVTFNYASELQFLLLNSNRIRTLVNESFKGLNKLTYLDLSDNRLQTLPEDIFKYLPSLQELNLAQNHLRVIENTLFTVNTRLISVILSENRLQSIGQYVFRNQQNLVLLDLRHNNKLSELVMNIDVKNLMAGNCSLDRVNIYGAVANSDLRDNKILELYYSQPEELETLTLRNNSLQEIVMLTRAVNLRVLDVSDNPELGNLVEPWTVSAMERLDLSNTNLTMLPIATLAAQINLTSLNVSNNNLSEINPKNFKYLQNLKNFYIHKNNWNCYNLRIVMDLLISLHRITYTTDEFDPEFPGEYINGISCMYRLEDDNSAADAGEETVHNDNISMETQNFVGHSLPIKKDPMTEVDKLRNELKAIVGFYEQKFDALLASINNLNSRLQKFEDMSSKMLQHVTITT